MSDKISKEEVVYIAKLARLELTEEEIEKFQHQLSDILTYIDKLNEVDTENVEITYNVNNKINALRDDILQDSFSYEKIFKNAPEVEDNHFKIPKVIE